MKWIASCLFVFAITIGAVGYLTQESQAERAKRYNQALEETFNNVKETSANLAEESQKFDAEIQEIRPQAAEQPEKGQELVEKLSAQWRLYEDGINKLEKDLLNIEENTARYSREMDKIASAMTDSALREAAWRFHGRIRASLHAKNEESIQLLHKLYLEKDRAFNAMQGAILAQKQDGASTHLDAYSNLESKGQSIFANMKAFAVEGLRIAREGREHVEGVIQEPAS